MYKSKIDWCDTTWNPVTGCRHECPYCYARRMAQRFSGYDPCYSAKVTQLENGCYELDADGRKYKYVIGNDGKPGRKVAAPYPFGFEPTLHRYRLNQPEKWKEPRTIFVCSMADLFGEWVPDEWIADVFAACGRAPQHRYLFLTKNPERYAALANAGKLPEYWDCPNFWYGTTVTKAGDRAFTPGVTFNTFLTIEPISGPLDAGLGSFGCADWIIVGAETGNRKGNITPERAWIENIIETASITKIPVLLKDSAEMRAVWGDELVQEFPDALRDIHESNITRRR